MFITDRFHHHCIASSGGLVTLLWPSSAACELCLSKEHEDDQVDVSSSDQVNDRMPYRVDIAGIARPPTRPEIPLKICPVFNSP